MGLETVRLSVGGWLFAAETEPDQVDGPTDSHEHADQSENPLVQPLVQPVPDTAPEDQAR